VSEHFAPAVYFTPLSNKVLEIVSIPNFCRENNLKTSNSVMQSEAWMNVGILWSFCNSSGGKFGWKAGNYNICTNTCIWLRRGKNGGFGEF